MRQNTVCDRCGETFPFRAGEEIGVTLYATGRRKYRKTANGIVSRNVDLCERCWKEFKAWAKLGPA
jgi:hypothetical protein